MGQVLKLTSPMPPSVNHYLGYRSIVKNNRPMVVAYKTTEAKRYQKAFTAMVKEEAEKQGWVKSKNKRQHYYMDCVYYFDRVDKDANNYFKCMADAITDSKKVWIDDTQLCERVQGIFYDPANPRVEITIYEVEYMGVLMNRNEIRAFDAQCNSCRRKPKSCGIRKMAYEGRVKCGVKGGICPSFERK